MEPITTSVISGLVTRALGGAAGSLPRLIRSRRQKQVRDALAGLSSSATGLLLPVLAGLGERDDGAQEVVGTFLGSVEAETYVRTVTCAVLSGELELVEPGLQEQLVALLVLVAGADQTMAPDLASSLLWLLVKTIRTAAQQLEHADKQLYASVSDGARAELRAGSLTGLGQRSRLLRNRDPAELADFLAFADRYRALLHDRTSDLVPAFFDVQRRVPIDKLYVPPRFRHDMSPAPLDDLLAQSYRTVILGDPGAGKSTLVRYLAHVYSGQPGVVPFVVTLRTYENWKHNAHGSVVDFLGVTIRESFQITVPDGAIDYLLLTGRAFVLFDGLDELLDIGKRHAICDVIASFADLYAEATVLVTSRRIGYAEAPINPARFTTVGLLSFTDDDVATYVANWFAIDDRLDTHTRETMVDAFLDESDSVRDIRGNALMLGLMCNLYRGIRTIPQNRADLYEKCSSMLFERWDASRGIASTNILRADAKAALQDIALWMFTTDGLSDGVTEKQLVSRLTEFWTRRTEDHGRATDVAKELVMLWRGRAWVLTDVGSSPTNKGLIYQFTHRTFLEFFAAVEIVRRNPTPAELWRVLAEPIRMGRWEIVPQLAIQKLDEFCLDGADQVLGLLVEEEEKLHGMPAEHSNLLYFAVRNLDSLYAKPSTLRRLVGSAMRLAMRTMGVSCPITEFHNYHRNADWFRGDVDGYFSDIMALWQPLLQLLGTTGDELELVIDELFRSGRAQLDSPDQKAAAEVLVFLLSPSYLEKLAQFASQAIVIDEVDIPRALWNPAVLERHLGRPLGVDQILVWGRHNFWAAVLAAREGLISVEDMVRSAGVASVACSAHPFIEFLPGLEKSSPLEQLLLRYLDRVSPYDDCRFDATEAHRTLATIGRELTEGVPTFGRYWLPTTQLYVRVVNGPVQNDKDNAPDDLDAAFGAAVLFAVVVEHEKWPSHRSLALGPLRGLEPIYLARIEGYDGDEIELAVDRFGFAEPRQRILVDWARKRTDFTVG